MHALRQALAYASCLLLLLTFALPPAMAQQATIPKGLIDDGTEEKPKPKPAPKTETPQPKPAAPKPKRVEPAAEPVQAAKPAPAKRDEYTTVYTDDFTSPELTWPEVDTKDATIQKRHNGYYIAHKRSKESWVTYKSLGFRPDDDFVLETKIMKIDGTQTHGYGIIWGYNKEPRNYYRFTITGNGSYCIDKVMDDKYSVIQDWTPSPHIVKGNASLNTLTIKKTGDTINFIINDNQVATMRYERPSYAKCGFSVANSQSIEVKSITFKSKTP